jgi:hypothetical protein
VVGLIIHYVNAKVKVNENSIKSNYKKVDIVKNNINKELETCQQSMGFRIGLIEDDIKEHNKKTDEIVEACHLLRTDMEVTKTILKYAHPKIAKKAERECNNQE